MQPENLEGTSFARRKCNIQRNAFREESTGRSSGTGSDIHCRKSTPSFNNKIFRVFFFFTATNIDEIKVKNFVASPDNRQISSAKKADLPDGSEKMLEIKEEEI
jgi:hypothetical protein